MALRYDNGKRKFVARALRFQLDCRTQLNTNNDQAVREFQFTTWPNRIANALGKLF